MYSVNGQVNREHKLKTGLLIGRFQPFHKGHDYLIKKALGQVDKLIIAIGSSNVKDTDNPFTYPQRKKILEIYIENEDMENKIVKIFPLPDNPSDDVWVRNAVKKAGRIDVIISNNELNVNRFFEKAGFKVLRFPFYKRNIYEGKKIRDLARHGKRWDKRVPNVLAPVIQKLLV
ncbi:MAG: hypothetical protein A2857_00690 [Candidatus Levybacteria bacterium RIFCSPHIGHO2_01_FULL_36_15]|nr:MAG: hypothetical protein A2857_00690 [Candidatus Levybacteria bacterium RIFCSPHIGHO2_01_FULL_36_15]OGH39239.1 MAG: hypothetical protein A2905_01675 [Candidatus Levybacteria bacterium RIFCSPLOWO2_01_FULL_36_10]